MELNIRDYYFNRFLNLIRATYMNLAKDWEDVASEVGLTHAQQHALWILHIEDGLTLDELGHVAMWNKSTTCALIGRLEKKGYIKKEKSDSNPRIKKIYITATGKDILDRSVNSNKAFNFMGLFNDCDKKEFDKFLEVLGKICHMVGDADMANFDKYLECSSDKFLNKDE